MRNQIYTDNTGGINKVQTRLMGVIRENPVVTVPELAEKVGIAYRTVERNLNTILIIVKKWVDTEQKDMKNTTITAQLADTTYAEKKTIINLLMKGF